MRDSAKRLVPPPMPAAQALENRSAGKRDSLIGQTIDGRYKVEALLGEGGMGLVYQARHTSLGKKLAIKVLRPEVSQDVEVLKRFKQEARSASNIGNQHIVDVSDFGVTPNGQTYFAMEHLDGVDLITAIDESKKMKTDRVVHIARQLCRALGAAHDAGIVHRDLKPENIYLIRRNGNDDFVKVLDFGIAKVVDSGPRLTKVGDVFGTPHYMSPEQSAGKEVDLRADIYALGVMLYEMLTGQVPFDADNLMGILTKHLYEEPIPPSVRESSVSESLEAVVLKCMAKEPNARYQSMRELEDDLARIDAGLVVSAPVSAVVRATRAPRKTKNRIKLAIGASAAAAIAIAAFLMLPGDKPAPLEQVPVVGVVPHVVPLKDNKLSRTLVSPAPTRKISIVSTPTGANVWLGDRQLGHTPLSVDAPATGSVTLSIRKAGYATGSLVIMPNSKTHHKAKLRKKRISKKISSWQRKKNVDESSDKHRPDSVLDPWAD